jgi:hypothetical protein
MTKCHCGKNGHPLHSINCPACSEALVGRVADAIINTMWIREELPLPPDLQEKYRHTARAAIRAMRGDGETGNKGE